MANLSPLCAGLSICKLLMKVMGGRIWVNSEGQGTGTTFHFIIPLSAISPDISFRTLQYALSQSEIEDPDTVLSFLSNTGQPYTKLLSEASGKVKRRSLCSLLRLSNGTNERVIIKYLEGLRDYSVRQLIVHSKEEAINTLALQDVDCIISDFLFFEELEKYSRNEGKSRPMPVMVLLASHMELEEAKKRKPTYPYVHFLKTPLRQLSLVHELSTILNSCLTRVKGRNKQEETPEKENQRKEYVKQTVQPEQRNESKVTDIRNNSQQSDSDDTQKRETKPEVKIDEPKPLVLVVEDNPLNQKVCCHSMLNFIY